MDQTREKYQMGGNLKGSFTSRQYNLGRSKGGHCTNLPLFDAFYWYHRQSLQNSERIQLNIAFNRFDISAVFKHRLCQLHQHLPGFVAVGYQYTAN